MMITGEARDDPTHRLVTTKDSPPRSYDIYELRVLDDTLDDFVDVQCWGPRDKQPAGYTPFADVSKGDRVAITVTKAEVYRERLRVTCVPSGIARSAGPAAQQTELLPER